MVFIFSHFYYWLTYGFQGFQGLCRSIVSVFVIEKGCNVGILGDKSIQHRISHNFNRVIPCNGINVIIVDTCRHLSKLVGTSWNLSKHV